WGPWGDVGMAAKAMFAHPLLGRRLVDTAGEVVYSVPLSHERHWVLADHCLKGGTAVLPGTGYLEMACAALTQGSFDQAVGFEAGFFGGPLLAGPSQTREARVLLHPAGNDAFHFSVRARDGGWVEHASGRVARCMAPPLADRAVDRIMA